MKGRSLVAMANLALRAGISVCGPGRPFKLIGQAIHDTVHRPGPDEDTLYSISPQFTGHGIGTDFHKPPWIIHDGEISEINKLRNGYLTSRQTVNEEPGVMVPGDCFTIEVSAQHSSILFGLGYIPRPFCCSRV